MRGQGLHDSGRPRLLFLLSGAGSTLRNLLHAIDRGRLRADVVGVLSDRRDAGGLQVAKERGVAAHVVERRALSPSAFDHALERQFEQVAPDLILLGGFLAIFRIPPAFAGRILNVHPSLLPAFGGRGWYGARVHRAVLARGCRITGCTVHYVTDEVDGGPIIEQAALRVSDNDDAASLAARVQALERRLYPRAVRSVLDGSVRLVDGRIVRTARP